MAIVEFLPREYGYVVLVLVFYCFLNLWMGAQVGRARKSGFCSNLFFTSFNYRVTFQFLPEFLVNWILYKVPYPTLYAIESENKDAKLFNCVQRGHQNSLEMMPMYFILMILGGMKHPCICAALGLLFNITRFFYFKGYSTGDPMKRLTIGKYGFLGLLGLMICTISFGVSLIRG